MSPNEAHSAAHEETNSVSEAFGISRQRLTELNDEKDCRELVKEGGVESIAAALHVNLAEGLQSSANNPQWCIEARVRAFGSNTMKEVDPKSFISLVLEQLEDPIIILLIVAATVSTILGVSIKEEREDQGWIDGVAIWVAVFVVAFVGALNDFQKDQQFRKLNAQKEVFDVSVIRDGKETLVKNSELVVGDILVLNTGDRVTADGLLFYNNDLIIDEASLTGESEPLKKRVDKDPFCRSGTQVTDGSGRILVIAVGENSEWGKTLALVTGETDETPLQEKLGDLAAAIGKLGFFVAVCSFVVLIIRWCVEKNGFPLDEINDDGPIQFFLFAVTIVVVAVPEGLPLAVTISLAYSMRKMMKDNNFVRVLAACETMGGATAICSDKTGTLTENRMTVVEGWFHGKKFTKTPQRSELIDSVANDIILNASLNSKAFLIEENSQITFVGNRTECALLMLVRNWGQDYHQIRQQYLENMVKVYGFNSAKKMASVIVNAPSMKIYNKGAAEMVLELCTRYMDEDGSMKRMTDDKRSELLNHIQMMASRGLRTLALTYNDLDHKLYSFSNGDAVDEPKDGKRGFAVAPEEDLILTAIVGIKDPVRAEVPAAVDQCKKAGIFVRMVTGDNVHTAKHIAKECGIYTDDGLAMEGPVFRRMAETRTEDLIRDLPRLQVLARSSPTDKHTLVSLLRQQEEVVAVTGDGTNDAPALKESDVGLAMGIAGTEVAKEAADIVILDDNFSSIVKAVLWGRSVFNNIRKFLQFQLTVNVVALVIAFVAAIVGGETPLNVLQLLWVNLIMDTLAALALATENPTPDLLDQKPHGRNEPLISSTMWKHILLQSLYQLIFLFVILYGFPGWFHRYEVPVEEEWYYEYCRDNADRLGPLGIDRRDNITVQQRCDDAFDCANGECFAKKGGGVLEDYRGFLNWMDDKFEDDHDDAEIRKNSVIFNTFIFMQVFNELNSRKICNEYNIFANIFDSPIFVAIFIGISGLQLLIMFTPMRQFFLVESLTGWEWLVSLAIGIGVIPYSLLVRFILRMMEARGQMLASDSV